MTKSRIVAWVALALCAQLSTRAAAQDMSFGLEETEAETPEKPAAEETPDTASTDVGVEASAEGDLIGDLATDESTAKSSAEPKGAKIDEVTEEIYAVQQIYAIRKRRIELLPSFGFTLNDPFVSHPALNVGLNYWITNVLAVGANLNWYQGLESESDLNFHVRRSTRLAIRPTEFQMGASLNFTYVPLYGKFAMFNRYIFQWDAYVLGGVGVMSTRPVPVVDPEFRTFDYSMKLSMVNPGIGFRVFVSKWLTVFAEMRDYIYLEELENLQVALGEDRRDESLWLEDSPTIVNNVLISVGMTLFFPFTFDYKLPK
jgi:outer membrane beta-barrel protein